MRLPKTYKKMSVLLLEKKNSRQCGLLVKLWGDITLGLGVNSADRLAQSPIPCREKIQSTTSSLKYQTRSPVLEQTTASWSASC